MKRLVSTLNLSKEDWLRYRKCGITGTDAGAILGVNPYRSAFQVYHDKISDTVAGTTIDTAQAIEKGKVQTALARAELREAAETKKDQSIEKLRKKRAELQREFDELANSITNHTIVGQGRIIKAFPEMKHRDYYELIKELRKKFEKRYCKQEC